MPAQSVCVVLNTESSNENVTSTLVTDVVLLLTMLVGLLRLRLHGSMFGLGQLLWRQVGTGASPLTDRLCSCVKGSGLAFCRHRGGGTPGGQSNHTFSSPVFDLLSLVALGVYQLESQR